MQQILSRPEIQSAVVPFAVALVTWFGLRKVTATAGLWALLIAFAASAVLINGLTITPLTGTRKIIMLITAALAIAAILPAILPQPKLQRTTATLIYFVALVWVFWAVVSRKPTASVVYSLIGFSVLVSALQYLFDRIATKPAELQAATLSLLLGVGLSATAAASALLGQLALALAAGCGGAYLGWVFVGDAKSGGNAQPITTLPYVLAAVLLGLAAVVFARLQWYALIPLAAIPLAVSLAPFKPESRFLQAAQASLPGLAIAIAVAFWVWHSSASDSGY